MSNQIKFNQNSGIAVSQVMGKMAAEIENDTATMLTALQQLHNYYKDDGYDAHSANISAVLRAMSDVSASFTDMSKAISDYTNRLFG